MKIFWFCIACITFGYAEDHFIDEIPPSGIFINTPGTYHFAKNLTWHPETDGAAINIQANDVILNMHNFTLRSSTTHFKTIGISVFASENFKVFDGKIKNMGLAGLKCTFCANVTIQAIEVDGLNVEDIANFVVPTGILASESLNVIIDTCLVKNIDVRTASAAAIQLTATLNSTVRNCTIKNLLNRDGACSGIGHIFSDQILIESCHLDNIKTTFIENLNTQGHTAIGIIPTLSANITIDKCSVSNVKGCCDDAHGMSIFLCENATVSECKVSCVLDGAGKAKQGAKATGIEVYGTNVTVSDCFVQDIFAINPEDKQSTGFSSGASNHVRFLRCIAKNVQVLNEKGEHHASLGYGTGFGWAPDPRPSLLLPTVDVLYHECTAKRCQVGFDSWFHINSVWDKITSIKNDIAILNQGPDAQRTLSCGPCSECGCTFVTCFPTPYVVTVNNVAQNNIFLDVTD